MRMLFLWKRKDVIKMGTTIKIKCIDQTLTYEGTPTVASGGVNEDYIQFEFGPLWDGFSKVAVFYRNKGEMYYGLVSTDNTVVVPKEVTATKGTMYLGVMGVNGDVTRTSQVLQYRIESGALDGFTPEEPTSDVYQQILTELQEIRDLSAETLSNEEAFETNLNGQMTTFRTEVDAEIAEKLSKVYRPCGSVANYEALPTDAEIGDVYNLLDTGVNYAWTGTEWDSLAGIVDLSGYVAKSDIVDNLTTDDSTKVLSANQGKALKGLIDDIDERMGKVEKLSVIDGTHCQVRYNSVVVEVSIVSNGVVSFTSDAVVATLPSNVVPTLTNLWRSTVVRNSTWQPNGYAIVTIETNRNITIRSSNTSSNLLTDRFVFPRAAFKIDGI